MSLFRKLAVKAHRTPAETLRLSEPWNVRAKYILAAGLVVAFVILFVPVFMQLMSEWSETGINVSIPPDSWKVYFGKSPGPCADRVTETPNCPAHPKNDLLWQSDAKRSDGAHVKRTREFQGREYWVGTTVSTETLRGAARARANHLLLGWVRATYRVWIDDSFYLGSNKYFIEPLIIALPMERLNQPKPLRVAIQIYHDAGHPYPDFLHSGLGGEGFVTYANSASYLSFRSVLNKARPISLFLANLLIAAMFFLFWTPAKIRQEYFYMAIYVLSGALYQARSIDLVFARLNLELLYSMDIVLRLLEGAFGMFIGLSFARVRPSVFRIGIPLSLLAPILILGFLEDTTAKFYFNGLIETWIVPSLFSIGVGACVLQGWYLYSRRDRGSYLPVRIVRLLLFAGVLSVITLLYWSKAHMVTSMTHHAYWDRIAHLALVCVLGAIVFREYSEEGLLVRKTPVSEYHRRPVLPSKLSGALLVADLKSSEPFYRSRARYGETENPVSIWRSHFYTAILKHGGTVVHKKGDELIGFFDQDRCDDPVSAAILAVNEMAQNSRFLEAEFQDRGLFPADAKGLHFRAALTTGEIRPVWEQFGENREAYWEEAGTGTPFVELSRLLEFERDVPGQKDTTLLIVPEALVQGVVQRNARLAKGFVYRDQQGRDKHGSHYRFAVFQPLFSKEPRKLAA